MRPQTGNDRAISRALPHEVAQAFVWHMAVIRPLQRIFAGVVYGSDSSTVNRMRTLVFPGVEDSLASENFGMIFREATKSIESSRLQDVSELLNNNI